MGLAEIGQPKPDRRGRSVISKCTLLSRASGARLCTTDTDQSDSERVFSIAVVGA